MKRYHKPFAKKYISSHDGGAAIKKNKWKIHRLFYIFLSHFQRIEIFFASFWLLFFVLFRVKCKREFIFFYLFQLNNFSFQTFFLSLISSKIRRESQTNRSKNEEEKEVHIKQSFDTQKSTTRKWLELHKPHRVITNFPPKRTFDYEIQSQIRGDSEHYFRKLLFNSGWTNCVLIGV